MIREGVVSAVYPKKCTCRVTFADRDNLVSAELPILQPAGAKNKFYSLVDVGDSVVCLMIPNDELGGGGFVLGSRYDDKKKPPAQNQNVSMIEFGDGSFVRFNRQSGNLDIQCKGDITINGRRIFLNE